MFDFDEAKRVGYLEDEIASHLAEKMGFNYKRAIDAGYTTEDIIEFLKGKMKQPEAEQSEVAPIEIDEAA